MSRAAVRVCIVGTARHTWRDPEVAAPEPLAMWEQVARAAIDDVGVRADVAAEIDHVGVVHTQSWSYDDPVARLAGRLGRPGLPGTYSILAGTSPQRLLDAAAAAMLRGEMSAALVVGAEAQATVGRLQAAGETPAWSHPDPAPVGLLDLVHEWYLPTEIRHGILPAWLTFALLHQARWAARGGRVADRDDFYDTFAAFSAVAARNPDAWFRVERTAAELATPTAANRMVARPFTKLTTAFPAVDMAAANLLVTEAVADRWQVPDDRRVYLRGWGFACDADHVAARLSLSSSPAMRAATTQALTAAGVARDEVDVFDLYSCFGAAVQFARDALDLDPADPRPLSLTGGLPYHGGPGSNYVGHSISHLVDTLRRGDASTGMVTGVGMHMTKHVAAVWSRERGEGLAPVGDLPQHAIEAAAPDPVFVRDSVDDDVVLRAATVVRARAGDEPAVVAIGELADGSRCYARSERADVVALVDDDGWVGCSARVKSTAAGTNELLI